MSIWLTFENQDSFLFESPHKADSAIRKHTFPTCLHVVLHYLNKWAFCRLRFYPHPLWALSTVIVYSFLSWIVFTVCTYCILFAPSSAWALSTFWLLWIMLVAVYFIAVGGFGWLVLCFRICWLDLLFLLPLWVSSAVLFAVFPTEPVFVLWGEAHSYPHACLLWVDRSGFLMISS